MRNEVHRDLRRSIVERGRQLNVAETAEVMGVTSGAVKRYTHHGLRKLRAALEMA